VGGAGEESTKVVAVEDVVAEDQGDRVVADELASEDEGLGEPLGARLLTVAEFQAELAAVAEEAAEEGEVVGGGDDQDLPDPRQHQGGEGVVDHRLVVDRQELLGDREGHRVEPGAGTAGEDNPLHPTLPSPMPSRSRR